MMRPLPAAPAPLAPMLERLAVDYGARGLAVAVRADGILVELAAEAMEIIFGNLLENALRYAGPGARVEIAAVRDANGVVIEVSDDGPGVSAGNAARVFEPFFTTGREGGGTGLGLPIVRTIIGSAGGTIDLVGSEPDGAAFRIWLPDRR